jgi:hypothetical protein
MSAPPTLGNTPTAPTNPAERTADDFRDYQRDPWGRPLIVQLNPDGSPVMVTDPKTGELIPLQLPYTRASRAGSVLEYQGALNSYHTRNALIGLVLREDLYFLAKSVPEPGGAGRREFDKSVVKPAQEAAGASGAANMGTALHSFAEKSDRGEMVPPLGPYQASLDAYRSLTSGWLWHGIECRLISDRFRMAGKADRIGSPPGWMVAPDGTIIGPEDRLVLDLKTSSSDRYFGVKFAVQLCVYAHGDLYNLETFERTPTGARTDWALVIHVPTGGSSGALYWVNLKRGAELVALAREVLDAQGDRDLVVKVADTAVYATLAEAEFARDALLAGSTAGITVAMPELNADDHDPEPSTATDPAMPLHVQADALQAQSDRGQVVADGMCGPDVVPTGVEIGQAIADKVRAARDETATAEHERAQTPAAEPDPGAGGVVQRDQPEGPEDYEPSNGSTVPPSVTDGIRPDLGRYLQKQAADAAVPQLERELNVIRSAGITSSLESVRERGYTWTPEHEAAYALREWELTIIRAIEAATTEDQLMGLAMQVSGWDRWTEEMRRLARRQSAILRGKAADAEGGS